MHDRNISPVGWYIGSYLVRFIELDSDNNEDVEARFMSWVNTIIVKADNLDEAYDKIVENASLDSVPSTKGARGANAKWVFEGVTELLPIYEELEDGAEVMWCEHKPRKLKNLRKMVREKGDFKQ